MGAWEDGFAAGWAAGLAAAHGDTRTAQMHASRVRQPTVRIAPKRKRKASAYSKRYGAAFKRLQKRYKTKAGAWRKGGFKACQKAAHKAARK